MLEVYRLVPGLASGPKSEFSTRQMRVFVGLESGRDVDMGKNIEGEQIFFWTIFSIKEVHSERVRDGSKYSFGHFLVIPNMLFDHYLRTGVVLMIMIYT